MDGVGEIYMQNNYLSTQFPELCLTVFGGCGKKIEFNNKTSLFLDREEALEVDHICKGDKIEQTLHRFRKGLLSLPHVLNLCVVLSVSQQLI